MPAALLDRAFYERPVLTVAEDLIGCVLEHRRCAGIIVETEAYHDSEPACHAHRGLTPRTRTLFGEPAHAYVYRSYGIHNLFNAVCEPPGSGAAVLIRALEPIAGIESMQRRRAGHGRVLGAEQLCSGPGKLASALAIDLDQNGSSLITGPIRIRRPDAQRRSWSVVSAPRIGISCATELPWRFCFAGNRHVSRPWPRP